MNLDYVYCNNQGSCIHRRGCKRWIGNYDTKGLSEETLNYALTFVDDEECMRDEDLEGVATAYSLLVRFRNSDGSEIE